MLQMPASQTSSARLLRQLGLRKVARSALTVERRANGDGFAYYKDGERVTDEAELERFRVAAMPPAYSAVRFAAHPLAHIQAVGRDDAGRLQYRYHANWLKLRESKKTQRLLSLVAAMPRVRKRVAEILGADEPTREFAFAAVIDLVSLSAIRPGNEEYARRHGTRGASTLLKSNVRIAGDKVTLVFRAKGGKDVRKEVDAPRLAHAIAVLRKLAGLRLFQYRDDGGAVRSVDVRHVNTFLRELAQADISLKDFRTLCASASVLEVLSNQVPQGNARDRHKQVLQAVGQAAAELANTPAVARKSYVHDAVVSAFEDDGFDKFAATLKRCRSPARREKLLAEIVTAALA